MIKLKNFIFYIFFFLCSVSFAELDSLVVVEFESTLEPVDGKAKKKKKPIKKMRANIRKKLVQKAIKRKGRQVIKHKKYTKKRKYTPNNSRFRKKTFGAQKHKRKKIKRKHLWNPDDR